MCIIGAKRVTETTLGRCKCFVVLFFVIMCLFFSFAMKIELLMVISVKKRSNCLMWTSGKFVLSGKVSCVLLVY